jgi:hypothetical protein
VGLAEEMEKQQKTVSDLLPYVDAAGEVVGKWVEETRPVPLEMQRVIAAWLHVPIRNLFTDMPPALREDNAQPPRSRNRP